MMDTASPSLQFPSLVLDKVALLFLVVAYTVRILWIHARFRKSQERQQKTGDPRTSRAKGALYSLFIIALPWDMESFRKHPLLYAQFVAFHLAIAQTIALAFIIPYGPSLLRSDGAVWAMRIILAFGAAAGVAKIVRRFRNKVLRTVSTLDDHFSVMSCTLWIISALFMISTNPSVQPIFLNLFFFLLIFLYFYAPFSKISHYLFYPFTRVWFGASMGYRGVYPLVRSTRPIPAGGGEKAVS